MSTALAAPSTTFAAPDDRTATEPPEHRGLARDEVRLLVAGPAGINTPASATCRPHLPPGDLLVVNSSATLAAEFDGRWRGSRPVVVHLAHRSRRRDLGRGTAHRAAPPQAPVLDAEPASWFDCPAGPAAVAVALPASRAPARPVAATGSGGCRCIGLADRCAVPGPLGPADRLWLPGRPDSRSTDYQTVFATTPGQRGNAQRRDGRSPQSW